MKYCQGNTIGQKKLIVQLSQTQVEDEVDWSQFPVFKLCIYSSVLYLWWLIEASVWRINCKHLSKGRGWCACVCRAEQVSCVSVIVVSTLTKPATKRYLSSSVLQKVDGKPDATESVNRSVSQRVGPKSRPASKPRSSRMWWRCRKIHLETTDQKK